MWYTRIPVGDRCGNTSSPNSPKTPCRVGYSFSTCHPLRRDKSVDSPTGTAIVQAVRLFAHLAFSTFSKKCFRCSPVTTAKNVEFVSRSLEISSTERCKAAYEESGGFNDETIKENFTCSTCSNSLISSSVTINLRASKLPPSIPPNRRSGPAGGSSLPASSCLAPCAPGFCLHPWAS